MRNAVILVLVFLGLMLVSCSRDVKDPLTVGMSGVSANCEYSVLTFRLPDGSLQELDINGLPVKEFWGAQLLCQSCNNPDNWLVLRRRGVSFQDIFAAAGIDVPDSTPVNFIGRDGWDPWRTVLGCNPDKLMSAGYLRQFCYIYIGSPGLKDPSLPFDAPGNFAKDPLYPEMEGRSLCLGFDFENILDAQVFAFIGGMELPAEGCFGQYRYSMLEKYSESMRGIIEIDPQP